MKDFGNMFIMMVGILLLLTIVSAGTGWGDDLMYENQDTSTRGNIIPW
jgi:hypothetical protein